MIANIFMKKSYLQSKNKKYDFNTFEISPLFLFFLSVISHHVHIFKIILIIYPYVKMKSIINLTRIFSIISNILQNITKENLSEMKYCD